jgi:hypothetical protein
MCGDVATPNLYAVAQQYCLQAPDTRTTVMGRRSGSSSSNDDVERAGPHTIRNTKNNLSRLFRLAEQQQLLSLLPISLTPQYNALHMPRRPGTLDKQKHVTYLRYPQWPVDLQQAFLAFQTWATAPLVPGRPAKFRKRLPTVVGYKLHFEPYFGYLHHIEHLTPTFDMLFDVGFITKYVHWHVNDRHQRSSIFIHDFLKQLMALTRQYRPMPEVRTQLMTLKKSLPPSHLTYDKSDAWVSLATLEDIAKTIWPRKQPEDCRRDTTHTGLIHAVHASLSLMLRLWVYRPYRQRNMREMLLGENLHKDAHGTWRITFHGEQLKIATKNGRPNVFDLPFPKNLVPLLEEYLTVWRPILLAKAGHPDSHVFLTRFGKPYDTGNLIGSTKTIVYRYTGKHWHPHIVRTVWATEWIRNSGDFHTAAVMLNDKLETVIARYTHLLEEDVAEKADSLIEERNSQGK